jgi:hypothetical protein
MSRRVPGLAAATSPDQAIGVAGDEASQARVAISRCRSASPLPTAPTRRLRRKP